MYIFTQITRLIVLRDHLYVQYFVILQCLYSNYYCYSSTTFFNAFHYYYYYILSLHIIKLII